MNKKSVSSKVSADKLVSTSAVNEMLGSSRALLPIRLGPNLLTYLDEMKKQRFLDEWRAALKTNLD